MASGSSAKKVARLAQKGKGKKVRFQGGTLFPSVMAIVLVLGLGLITYARQSSTGANTKPTINDHWHISYGFYICDKYIADLTGTKENPVDPLFLKYGIHSHGDGVIHWHPQALATGTRAKFGVFLDTYGVKVTAKGISFGSDQNGGKSYVVGTDKCKDSTGKMVDAQVEAIVWPEYDKPDKYRKYITDFGNIRVTNDQMAVSWAYVIPGTKVPMPTSASNLPALGAKDSAATTTTVAGATTATAAGATATTVKGATTTTAKATSTTAVSATTTTGG